MHGLQDRRIHVGAPTALLDLRGLNPAQQAGLRVPSLNLAREVNGDESEGLHAFWLAGVTLVSFVDAFNVDQPSVRKPIDLTTGSPSPVALGAPTGLGNTCLDPVVGRRPCSFPLLALSVRLSPAIKKATARIMPMSKRLTKPSRSCRCMAGSPKRSSRKTGKDPELVAFGLRLHHLRERAELTQEGLADVSGLHWTYVGQIERGEPNLTYKNILKLARGLGVEPEEMLRD